MQRGYAFWVVRWLVRSGYAPGCSSGLCAQGFVGQIDRDATGFHKVVIQIHANYSHPELYVPSCIQMSCKEYVIFLLNRYICAANLLHIFLVFAK